MNMRKYDITIHENKILPINLEFEDDFEYSDDFIISSVYNLFLKKCHQIARKKSGIVVARGQFLISYKALESEIDRSHSQVRLILKKLKDSGYILSTVVNKKMLITVLNYELATTGKQESNLPEHTGITPKYADSHKPAWDYVNRRYKK